MLAVTTKYLLTESEVCTGNIKLRPCCIDREMAKSRFDISRKTERSKLVSILQCHNLRVGHYQ